MNQSLKNEIVQVQLLELAKLYESAQYRCLVGDWEGGEKSYEEAVKLHKSVLGQDREDMVLGLHKLGMVYRINDKLAQAESTYKLALKLAQLLWGNDDLRVATRLNYLAGVYNAERRFDLAEVLIQQSLQIYEHNLSPDDPVFSLTTLALAIVAKRQGKIADGDKIFERYKQINAKGGYVKNEVVKGLCTLAEIYYAGHKFEESDLLFRHALIMSEQEAWPDHPFVADSLMTLAQLYAAQGRTEEAEQFYLKSIETTERLLGKEHPKLQSPLAAFASLLHKMDRHYEAKKVESRINQLNSK